MKKEEIEKLFEGKIKDCNNTNSIFNTNKYILLEDAVNVVNKFAIGGVMAELLDEKWKEYRSQTNNEDAWLFKQWLICNLP